MSIVAKATEAEVNSFVDLGLCSQSPLSPLCFLSTHYDLYDKWLWLCLIWTLTDEYKLGWGGRKQKGIGSKYSI